MDYGCCAPACWEIKAQCSLWIVKHFPFFKGFLNKLLHSNAHGSPTSKTRSFTVYEKLGMEFCGNSESSATRLWSRYWTPAVSSHISSSAKKKKKRISDVNETGGACCEHKGLFLVKRPRGWCGCRKQTCMLTTPTAAAAADFNKDHHGRNFNHGLQSCQ